MIIKADTAFLLDVNPLEISPRSYIEFQVEGEAPSSWELGISADKDGNVRNKLIPVPVKDGKYSLPISDFAEGKKVNKDYTDKCFCDGRIFKVSDFFSTTSSGNCRTFESFGGTERCQI